MVCLHGFTDTWRTWELVLPELRRHHDVLAPTLPGHAGGPPLPDEVSAEAVLAVVERAMDEAGFGAAHLVGNSLGGYLALRLAARGRALSVVALAPAGGWEDDDPTVDEMLGRFEAIREQVRAAIPLAPRLLATPEGRAAATQLIVADGRHLPAELIEHQMLGIVRCDGLTRMVANARRRGFPLDAERVTCPVRIVWGTADRVLAWPAATARYRRVLPTADWVELDGVGHCPQLDAPLETTQLILGVTGG